MASQPAPPTRRRPERALAWLVTGPLGHGWSALADLAAFFFKSLCTRTRERVGR